MNCTMAKSPSNNLRIFDEVLDQLIDALFFPARGFSSSPRPGPLEKAPPRTSLLSTTAF